MALLILTALTVGAAYIDLGSGNVVVALIIATIKASLVALFFMHLRWEKPVNGIIAMAGFLFLGIFLMFDLMDQDTPQLLSAAKRPSHRSAADAGYGSRGVDRDPAGDSRRCHSRRWSPCIGPCHNRRQEVTENFALGPALYP